MVRSAADPKSSRTLWRARGHEADVRGADEGKSNMAWRNHLGLERRQLQTLQDELEIDFSTQTASPIKPVSRSTIYSKNGA